MYNILEMSTFTLGIKWTFGVDKLTNLVKVQCTVYLPEYIFRKSHVIKLIKFIDQLHLSKCIPNVSF